MIDYSVIIRTTGKAGEKYQALLDSIKKLSPQPKEVIVVLPEEYDLPKERLGTETFYFCEKGMVKQRLYGINQCKTKYALISDDDISFEPNFVEKLYEPLKDGKYCFSMGPLLNFFPSKGKQTIAAAILGEGVPTLFHKDKYNTVLRTTGYSFNRNIDTSIHQLYETETAAWTNFFANMDLLKSIHFEDELWLDKAGYSAHDDTCMFYKGYLLGKKSVVVSDALYNHLDGKTSTRGINKTVCYAKAFNSYVFWHRFIYTQEKNVLLKLWSIICIHYYFNINRLYLLVRSKEELSIKNKAYRDAKEWVKSDEYKSLKSINRS